MAIKTIQTMRLVGGHPALDLINTVDAREGRWGPDLLVDRAAALRWAQRAGLLSPDEIDRLFIEEGSSRPDGELLRLVEARELLYRLFLAEAERHRPNPTDIHRFERLVQMAHAHRSLLFTDDGRSSWLWSNNDSDTVLHRVVLSAADLLTDVSRRRVSVCRGQNCGWLFLDRSRAGNRRWCSDEGCGSHSRVRKFRSHPGSAA